jgi:ABC-type glycerol-3-phosphate transport system permease component
MSMFLDIVLSVVLIALTGLAWSMLWKAINDHINRQYPDREIPFAIQAAGVIPLVLLLSAPLNYLTVLVIRQTLEGGSWLQTFHVQILPFIAEPFSIFLFYQFFLNIPKDFDEAAYIDGASRQQVYWQIIVPLSKPVFATVAILKMMAFWSFFLWPLLVTREETHRPLMVGISYFYTEPPVRWGSIMAYSAMVIVPVLVVFLLFQRWFVASLSSSGVKG